MYRGEGTSHRGDVILNREFRLNFEAFRRLALSMHSDHTFAQFQKGITLELAVL